MSQATGAALSKFLKIGLLSEIPCDVSYSRVSSCHFSNPQLLGSCFSPALLGKSRSTRARSDQHHHIPNLTGNASLYYICQTGLASRLNLSKLGRIIRDCSMDVESNPHQTLNTTAICLSQTSTGNLWGPSQL
jgi:hypothetical protein